MLDPIRNDMIGKNIPVWDAAMKVTGRKQYVDDMRFPRMLYGKILFSPIAHGRIKSIHLEEAKKVPGVRAIVCYKDSPKIRYNGNGEDKDIAKSELVFDQVVRYVGDKVAAVAAETKEAAEQAIRLIQVEYEPLPIYTDLEQVMEKDAYPIHEGGNIIEEVNMSAGDVDKAMEEADYIFEGRYQVPQIHHGAIEPHGAIADYDALGKLTIYTPTQDVFGQRINLSRIFQLPMNRIRVISPAMGGGFGGKIDLIVEPVAALLSMKTGRPVKIVLNRREDMIAGRCRHAMTIYLKSGVRKNGEIIAQDMKAILNAGAHTGATMSVTWAMGSKMFKLLKTPNLRFHGIPVYTNTTISGAMRGFGTPQCYFALQRQMNEISEALKIDMASLELLNLADPYGEDMGSKESFGNSRQKDCVKKGCELFEWEEGKREQEESKKAGDRYRVGVGMAIAPHGNGIYGVMPDTTGIMLKINEDGSLVLFTGVSDMGNGSLTLQCQIASEVLGITMDRITTVHTDTDTTLPDLGAYASRGTYVSGGAVVKAAKHLRGLLAQEAEDMLHVPKEQIEFPNNHAFDRENAGNSVTIEELAVHAKDTHENDFCCSDTFGSYASPISYGCHFAKVSVDTLTGEVKMLSYAAVHDVGKAINPRSVEGQIEGGIQMGIGYALSESLIYDEEGKVKNNSFRNYHMYQADEMPKTKIALIEKLEETGPYGAKSIGECATVPSATAVANAVSNALDITFCQLPITAERILQALSK